jgi:hypothetical protein
MAIRKEEEKKAIDNITYKMDKDKKTDDMLFAKLNKQQKLVLNKKKKIADMTGEPVDIKQLVNDKLFQTIGDKKNPATEAEIKEFLEE